MSGRWPAGKIRNTTFALLGTTTAVALGVVALFAMQGWPLLPPSPLPVAPTGHVAIHAAGIVESQAGLAGGAGSLGLPLGPVATVGGPPAPGGSNAGVAGQSPVHQAAPAGPGGQQAADGLPESQPVAPEQPPAAAPVTNPEGASDPASLPEPTDMPSPGATNAAYDFPGNGEGAGEEGESHRDDQADSGAYGHSGAHGSENSDSHGSESSVAPASNHSSSHGHGHGHSSPPAASGEEAPAPAPAPAKPPAAEEPAGYNGHGYGHSSSGPHGN